MRISNSFALSKWEKKRKVKRKREKEIARRRRRTKRMDYKKKATHKIEE